MGCRWRFAVQIGCLFAALSSSATQAQILVLPWQFPAAEEYLGESGALEIGEGIRLSEEEIAEYDVAQAFFIRARAARNTSFSWVWEKFLGELGIDTESPAAEFFEEIVDSADSVLRINTVNLDLVGAPEAFETWQLEALDRKAYQLGTVFRTLQLGLLEAGVSDKALVESCATIRSGLSVVSTDDDYSAYLEAVSSFDRAVSEFSESEESR